MLAGLVLFLTSTTTFAALNLPPTWRWSNPRPHGANIFDMAYGNGYYVQACERGQIFISDDTATWYPRDTGLTNALMAVTFFGGRLVITGEEGVILISDNLTDFYSVSQSTTDWLMGAAASSNLVVAVGDNGAIYTSTNAVTWQRATVGFTTWLTSVAYGSNTFVAVGENGFTASSANGTTWNVRTSGTTTNLNRVAWLGDQFMALGEGGKVFTSPQGGAWTAQSTGATNSLYAAAAGTNGSRLIAGISELRLKASASLNWSNQFLSTLPAPAPAWTYYAALWDDTGYFVAGRTGLMTDGTKTNGTTHWYTETNSLRTWLWSLARTPDYYIAVGDYATILTSPNGLDWSMEVPGQDTNAVRSVTNSIFLGVGGSTNLFLTVGSGGAILWSTNIFKWNVVPAGAQRANNTNDLQGVCHDGRKFLVCGGNGTILTSASGTNWTKQTTPTNVFLTSITPYTNGYVAVGDYGVILTSTNATNWVRQTSGTTNWLWQVRAIGNWLYAVGENGVLLTSANGTNWIARTSGTTAWLNAIDYVSGAWFIAGNQGAFLVSTNATNWSYLGTVTRKSLYGLVIHSNQLVTVGSEGVIIRSQLVPPATPVSITRYSRSTGQDLFLFSGQPDQQFYLRNSGSVVTNAAYTWTNSPQLEFYDSTGTLLYLEEAEETNASPRQFYRTMTAE